MISTILTFTESIEGSLNELISTYRSNQIFLLCDKTTENLCLPLIKDFDCLRDAHIISIESSDTHKNTESLVKVWQFLSQNGGTRKSVLINLGGGMVTDLGGFAAATFKRGIDCINIPTTILGAVDASVGGKTGINFNGLKNEIGSFHMPRAVVFYSKFFKSIDRENVLSGFAEMLKHGLLSDNEYLGELFSLNISEPDSTSFLAAIKKSVWIKDKIISQDPEEKGLRKALNLGHTAGHAFESFSHRRGKPVLHGFAIAWGLICELYLSAKLLGFPSSVLQQVIRFVKEEYGIFHIKCDDYPYLYETMTHDKKNDGKGVNFTLLSDIGKIELNQKADKALIEEMLDFYRDAMGI